MPERCRSSSAASCATESGSSGTARAYCYRGESGGGSGSPGDGAGRGRDPGRRWHGRRRGGGGGARVLRRRDGDDRPPRRRARDRLGRRARAEPGLFRVRPGRDGTADGRRARAVRRGDRPLFGRAGVMRRSRAARGAGRSLARARTASLGPARRAGATAGSERDRPAAAACGVSRDARTCDDVEPRGRAPFARREAARSRRPARPAGTRAPRSRLSPRRAPWPCTGARSPRRCSVWTARS